MVYLVFVLGLNLNIQLISGSFKSSHSNGNSIDNGFEAGKSAQISSKKLNEKPIDSDINFRANSFLDLHNSNF